MKFASATNLDRNSGERSGGTCFLSIPLAILEGSHDPPLCHPDRSVPEFLFRYVRQIRVCGFH
jgi:hypothetical protein